MFDLSPIWISLRIAAIATSITCCLGITAAHFMQRYRGRGRSLLDSLFLAPLVLPPTVLGFLLLLLLGKNSPLGSLLSNLGISVVFTWYAAVLTAIVVAFPLMYKTALGAFEQIDSNLQQAARTLGASELTVFWRITLPLTLPSLLAGTTLAFARALGEFGATLMLAGNIPGRTQTLPMAIYFAVEASDFREAALWSSATLILSLGSIALVNQFTHLKTRQKPISYSPFPVVERSRSPHFRRLSVAAGSSSPALGVVSSPRLEVNICKQLSEFTLAVNFTTYDPHPLGLLGASGAGKSLILRCIAGIETPDAGRIVLDGRVLFDSEKKINLPSCDRKIGILFQNYALFPHLTVAQNIAFGLHHRSLPPIQIEAITQQQLTAVQLSSLAQRYPHELSGGQQQRVALARALTNKPEVLLLDEPFSALDTHLRSQVEQQLKRRLQSYPGITLLVTHNLEEAYRICHALLVLESGHVAAHAPKHQIFEQPQTVSVARLTGCKNCSRAIAREPHQLEALDWQCTLTILEPLPPTLTHIGIRAHQITFLTGSDTLPKTNTFPCWPAATSETPHRMTLFLKLNAPSDNERDYHLQAEVFKEKWATIKDQALPWQVVLDPLRLILLRN